MFFQEPGEHNLATNPANSDGECVVVLVLLTVLHCI